MLIWFAETTLVAGLLAVVAAGAGRLRRIGPTARHLLWLAVLVKLLSPPLMSWPWALRWPESRIATPPAPEPSLDVLPEPSIRLAAVQRPPSRPTTRPEPAAVAATFEAEITPASPPRKSNGTTTPPWPAIGRGTLAAWLMLSGLLACGQTWRIVRFRRRLALGVPAPDELIDLSIEMAGQLETRVPDLLVVPGLSSPMLWCLGRPRILLPAALVKTLDLARWRGILAHELAHLRRGDHWVSRLELLAGWIWWWNPLYWLARSRLDAEAELACDAWVVWALPDHRLAYAETLFAIGSATSRAVAPAPALGAAGPGRLLERRLTMILRESVPYRLSPAVLLAAALLIVFSLPSWSAPSATDPTPAPALTIAAPAPSANPAATRDDDPDDDDDADDDDDNDDDDDADDDDDDDDDKAAVARRRAEARARVEARAKARAEAREKSREARARARAASPGGRKDKGDGADDIAARFGPEFEKKMERLGKEIEAKFGPGSDFEKKMEQLGKEMEAKFGPGSDFEKKMKDLGKEMEAKFGPGSDFEKQMKELGTKLGPGSDFEKQMKGLGEKMAEKARARARAGAAASSAREKPAPEPETGSGSTAKADAKVREAKTDAKVREAKADAKVKEAKARRREARIAALEGRIRKLAEELKALEAEEDDDR